MDKNKLHINPVVGIRLYFSCKKYGIVQSGNILKILKGGMLQVLVPFYDGKNRIYTVNPNNLRLY